jgi:hypothetical protein
MIMGELAGEKPPAGWFAALETTGNARDLLDVRIQEARASADWATVADLCAQADATGAMEPEDDWYRAEALNKLGRNAEVIKVLQGYVRTSVRDYHYPEACRLLKVIPSIPVAGAR